MLNFQFNFRHNFRYSRYTSVFTSSPWQPCATHPCVMHSCALLMHPCAMAQLQVLQVHAQFSIPAPDSSPSMCTPHVQPCATHPCVMHPCALYMHPCAMHHMCSLCIHHQTFAPDSTQLNQLCIRKTPRHTARVLYPVCSASVFRGAFKLPSDKSKTTSPDSKPPQPVWVELI